VTVPNNESYSLLELC